MFKQYKKRFWALISASIFISSLTFSQVDNVDFLKAGVEDGAAIAQAYIAPWANAFGAGINGNWYNSAKPHKLSGFDITFGANLGFIPSSDNTFDVSSIGLKTFTGTGMAPTVSGPDTEGPTLTGPILGGIAPISFSTPPGTNWKVIPVPSLQAGIGLPLGSEIKIRYIPKIPISDGDVSLWGIGLMHSIMQYLPGNKMLPLDVSLFGGYTKLTGNVPIELEPGQPQFYSTYDPLTSFNDQNFSIVTQAWNLSLIGSFNLPIISFYGGLGYAKTSTTLNINGNFPIPTLNPALSLTDPVYEDAGVLNDFPTIDIKNFSGIRANIGFRLTFHADYTRAYYNVLSSGLGISFR
jgi:hypothetical protein